MVNPLERMMPIYDNMHPGQREHVSISKDPLKPRVVSPSSEIIGETITSFDVKALFISVPVQPAIQIVKQRLQQDNTLPQRTSMSIQQITSLVEFCLSHTYLLFQGKYYEQVQGAAMGSPISPS